MSVTGPSVFISYTHDDDHDHYGEVGEFASFLMSNRIVPIIDQWAGVRRQDWYAWAQRGIPHADFVIVVASSGYRRMGDGNGPNEANLGGQSEAALLRDLLQRDRARWTAKMLPVVLPGHTIDEIPDFLQPYAATHYIVTALTVEGAENLLRALTGQPAHIPPPLGPPVHLPPRSGPGAVS